MDTSKILESEYKDESPVESGGRRDDLGFMGLDPQPTARYIGRLEIITVGWSICISWIAIIATLAIALPQGGPLTLIYGIITIFTMYICIVGTLGELASVYPSAGGQYHWTAILAPKGASRVLGYICGWVNICSWLAISASVALIIAEVILAIVIFYDSTYEPQAWHYFLVYQGTNAFVVLHNIFSLRHTMWTFNVSLVLSTLSYIIILVACLARSGTKQPSSFVWATVINRTGWTNDGIVFLMGLVSPNYMYLGIDGAIHLAETCTNPTTAVPQALVSTLTIGFVTAFSFTIGMLYSISDVSLVENSATGFPIYELWAEATRSDTAATIFIALVFIAGMMAWIACEQTSGHLTWSFARDHAMIASSYLGRMHPKLEVPVWALLFNGVIVGIIGCVYLGSSTAFYAFIGTGIILQLLSFAMPAALLIYRRRSPQYLPSDRYFRLPSVLGWIANFVTVGFGLLCFVTYQLPTIRPVTSSNMNYSCVVIGIMAFFAVINWYAYAQKHYRGPKVQGL